MRNNKRPRDRDSSVGEKTGLLTHDVKISPEKFKPLFSLEYITVDDYDMKACNKEEKAIFFDAIYKRSGLTWGQIRQANHEDLGRELLQNDELCKRLRKKAKKPLTDDVELMIFRARNSRPPMRIVGHRDGQIFYILFLDPKGTLYSHD